MANLLYCFAAETIRIDTDRNPAVFTHQASHEFPIEPFGWLRKLHRAWSPFPGDEDLVKHIVGKSDPLCLLAASALDSKQRGHQGQRNGHHTDRTPAGATGHAGRSCY
jgi:hypothetical protein